MARDGREIGSAWTSCQRHAFAAPSSPELASYVERYWVVSWRYDEPYWQLIVPYPNVHLVFGGGAATVRGVRRGHHVKVLSGSDGVFGVAFRPGCFRPFLGRSVSTITDRSVDASEIFGPGVPERLDVTTVERYLLARLPPPDPGTRRAAAAVAMIAAKPLVTRVDALTREFGGSVRQMQRLFAEYVGVGPKWVIRRYRLHEVTERLARGGRVDWAALAAELGYADQAHFVRDFTEMFGESPTWYAARY